MSIVENLSKRIGDFQLKVDRLEISDEGVTVLKGASGSGKTTFLNLLTFVS